jgi:hypothetical protein
MNNLCVSVLETAFVEAIKIGFTQFFYRRLLHKTVSVRILWC